jgi:hypothetical protein
LVKKLTEVFRSNVKDDDWMAWLNFEIGLDMDEVEEELVVNEQLYYSCPRRETDLLV